MTKKVFHALAFELVLCSFLWLAYGNREILIFRRLKAARDEITPPCNRSILEFISGQTDASLLGDNIDISMSIAVHRNGEPEACGSSPFSRKQLNQALQTFTSEACPKTGDKLSKYFVESLLTELLRQQLQEGQCESMDTRKNPKVRGFLGFCDMGPDRTVPQPDSIHLVTVPSGSLPCRFFTREGVRISSIEMLVELVANSTIQEGECLSSLEGQESTETCLACRARTKTLDLFAVPAGRLFMFAPKYVGERFELSHVKGKNGKQLSLKVLSLNPRVFDVFNFFSPTDADLLINKTLRERSDAHKLHRSTTVTPAMGSIVYSKRTSENAWDTHGAVAQILKTRCLRALGFDTYYESHLDGLQILRYNVTTAYTPHMDYLTDIPRDKYDYRSEGRGGNRFATFLLYMSDSDERGGGETVFSKASPVRRDSSLLNNSSLNETLRILREQGHAVDVLAPGSWEEEMTAQCHTRLTVRPKKSGAILFYSQFPNGTQDPMSEHGGCPVLRGTKWAANLWVWNAARKDYQRYAPWKFGVEDPVRSNENWHSIHVSALFFNSGKDPKFNNAQLYWQDEFFNELGPGESIRVNTYVSHVWNVKDSRGVTLQSWTIRRSTSTEQHFTV